MKKDFIQMEMKRAFLCIELARDLILSGTGAYGGTQCQSEWVLACLRPRVQSQHLSRNKKIIGVLPRIIFSLHGLTTSSYDKTLIKELENCSTWHSHWYKTTLACKFWKYQRCVVLNYVSVSALSLWLSPIDKYLFDISIQISHRQLRVNGHQLNLHQFP